MAQLARCISRCRRLRLGRLEERLLLGIVLLGSSYPILREAFPGVVHIICGLPTPDGVAVTRGALMGKFALAASLALAVPWMARACAGSWIALTRVSALRGALVIAAVATTTLTAYDACTGFHAADRTSQGCACWLTALLAGLAALIAALSVLAGRVVLRFLRKTVRAMVAAFFERRHHRVSSVLYRSHTRSLRLQHAHFAYRYAGRAPPSRSCPFFA